MSLCRSGNHQRFVRGSWRACAAGRQFARHQEYRWVNCRFSGPVVARYIQAQRRGRQRPGSFSTCKMPLMTRRSAARSTPRTFARGCFCYSHAGPARSDLSRSIRSVRGANHNARVSSRGSTDLRSKWAAVAQPPGCRSRTQIPVPSMELPRIRPRFSVQAKSQKHCRVFSSADAES
jgi:hypothetical protein